MEASAIRITVAHMLWTSEHAEHLCTLNLFNWSSTSDQEGIPAASGSRGAGTLWCEETRWMGAFIKSSKINRGEAAQHVVLQLQATGILQEENTHSGMLLNPTSNLFSRPRLNKKCQLQTVIFTSLHRGPCAEGFRFRNKNSSNTKLSFKNPFYLYMHEKTSKFTHNSTWPHSLTSSFGIQSHSKAFSSFRQLKLTVLFGKRCLILQISVVNVQRRRCPLRKAFVSAAAHICGAHEVSDRKRWFVQTNFCRRRLKGKTANLKTIWIFHVWRRSCIKQSSQSADCLDPNSVNMGVSSLPGIIFKGLQQTFSGWTLSQLCLINYRNRLCSLSFVLKNTTPPKKKKRNQRTLCHCSCCVGASAGLCCNHDNTAWLQSYSKRASLIYTLPLLDYQFRANCLQIRILVVHWTPDFLSFNKENTIELCHMD